MKKLKFHKKNQNLHGCLLPFTVTPSSLQQRIPSEVIFALIGMIAKARNFTAVESDDFKRLMNYNEVTFEKRIFFVTRIMFDQMLTDDLNHGDYVATLPIKSNEIFLITTPGEQYSDFEKLLLPFDDETWMYLILTFGCAFFFIFGINLLPRLIQDLVYGKSIKTPAFNIVGKF
jgi:hypothetical protein